MSYNDKTIPNNIFSIKKLISFAIVIFIFISDRVSKIHIINNHSDAQSTFVNNFLNFDLVWNTGIGFGLLDLEANFFYHAISFLIFIIILVIFFILIMCKNIEMFYYSMILGGALGNFYDRAVFFAVPDFIDLHINNYHWFTFNIADIFISIGILLILLRQLIIGKNEKN
ncbi:MAG: signal peptidase II [Pelagibacteraceae bacterium]